MLRRPVLAYLAAQPVHLAFAFGAAGLHFLLRILGLPGWPCPLRLATGLPCPGCGLTTALRQLAIGQWASALAIHPFAPLVALLGLALLPALFPSPSFRQRWTAGLAAFETRTRLVNLGLLAFLAYGVVRLLLALPALAARLAG